MNVKEAIWSRRSIRKFKEGAVISKEDIKLLLEAGMMAPSARNRRPWEFIVVTNISLKKKLAEAQPYCRHLLDAYCAIIVCGKVEEPKTGFWQQDCAAAIDHIMLMAVELGYGSCWCGLYPVVERSNAVKALTGASGTPLGIIALGVPDESPEARGFYDPTAVRFID